jgi:uncharacterized membrane protein YtjA (UPF0391 family)
LHNIAGQIGVGVDFLARRPKRRRSMLQLALLFLIVALIAGVLGLSGVAWLSSNIAWTLFVIFLILFVISLAAGALRGRPPL